MIRYFLTIVALICANPAYSTCRQALALGLDVSGSVDAAEYRMQIDGLADALNSEEVREVLLAPAPATVSIAVYEWSGPNDPAIILDWIDISSSLALDAAIVQIRRAERRNASPTTAIGAALFTGFAMLEQQPNCWHRTLDLSGDGKSNSGTRPQDVLDELTPNGVTVNGLVIGAAPDASSRTLLLDADVLAEYYEAWVIRGPGAFVEAAYGFEDYKEAMQRKLLRELDTMVMGQNGPMPAPNNG